MGVLKTHDFSITYVKRKRDEKGELEIVDVKDINVSVETKYKRQTSAKYAISKGLHELNKNGEKWDYYMWS
tara:strand:- start:858 stop:1070 length:213 start_codon:yes stop_codon:yes gene_type:complete